MKIKLIFCLFLIFFTSCDEQKRIETEQYVSDVETIEYLTLNLCLNEQGKSESVKIIPEKTTHKNQNRINKIIQQNKNIEYPANSKLNGNCFDITYRFVNEKYKDKKVTERECKSFAKFKTGNFKYVGIANRNVKIQRTISTQTETDGDLVFIYDIQWNSDCEYSLTYKEVNDDKFEYLVGKTIDVKIIDILANGTYLYHSNLLDRTIVTGVMIKI